VPIVRNVPLARDLLARAEVGEIDPGRPVRHHRRGDPVGARVRARSQAQRARTSPSICPDAPRRRIAAPGEDLTHYPRSPPWNRSH
jgi:hypothetical protein